MKRYRQGLVVGKFCPLHLGHMHLIRTALDACDEVLIVSYTKPEFDRCGPAAREAWLAALFPQAARLVVDDALLLTECARRGIAPLMPVPDNDADAAIHREFSAWSCSALAGVVVDAVFTSESYGDGFAQALSGYFSDRLKRPHVVTHVSVDPERCAVPVSGTRVREDPHAWRRYLDPVVYADFIDRICILGGESSGKTTLVAALAQALDTVGVPEVGRLHWEEKGGAFTYDDMRVIAEGQIALEITLAQDARRWLVCDGSALTTVFYSEDGYGKVDAAVQALARRPYAMTFVCAPDIPFVQDGTRRDAAFRQRQHAWYLATLERAGIPYVILAGSVEERVATSLDVLAARAATAGS
ncbi:AAA family ATPase [Massilia sp. G4R7]|uniref:AAA family ATPase n=1 Tax=Massilia phyllostachyos TaxID=2898585 RepID=A0ABS8QBQ7_9BURK|nr:AAA family ATPase [Massilia phyllostachyos]MCD2519024.1 AAA family ATPase [Massilia phyllostachyos]